MSPAQEESWELFRITVSPRTEWLVLRVGGPDGDHGYGECSDAGPAEYVVRELDRFVRGSERMGFTRATTSPPSPYAVASSRPAWT